MKAQSSILALGIGVALSGMMATSQAQAGVLGSSIFEISNFFIQNADGNVPTGITINSDVRNGEIAVGLNGVNTGNTGNAGGSGNLNILPVQLGAPANILGDNSTAILPDGSGTFSRSDLFVSGTIFGTGGQGLTRSDAYALSGDNQGNANSTIANNVLATYSITVEADTSAQFVTDADVYLKAFVSNDLFNTASSANASISFSVDVKNSSGTTIFAWAPEELNRGVAAFGVAGFNDVGGFNAYTGLASGFQTLSTGVYSVTIQQKSTAREVAVNQIPEPSIIVLLGIGLVGFGFVSRSKGSSLQA